MVYYRKDAFARNRLDDASDADDASGAGGDKDGGDFFSENDPEEEQGLIEPEFGEGGPEDE